MSSIDSIKLDQRMASAYRRGQADNWLVNYFKFPEFPETLSPVLHGRISHACDVVLRVLKSVSNQMMAGEIELEGKPLLAWMDIPNHCSYWIKKYYNPDAELFWGRPDFHLQDGNPWLLESNLASAAGYQQQVAGLYTYYTEHPQLMDNYEEGGFEIFEPMSPLLAEFEKYVKPGERVLIPDIYEEYRHKKESHVPYQC